MLSAGKQDWARFTLMFDGKPVAPLAQLEIESEGFSFTWRQSSRPPRSETKARNRERQRIRRELVHAAGCVFRFNDEQCATRGIEREDYAESPRVSVPRSLRHRLGRYVGGEK